MTHTTRTLDRCTGALYLTTHVTSVAAVVVFASGALAAGVLLEAVLALGCLGTGILLWLRLRHAGPARAATFGLLRTVEACVILVGTLPMIALDRAGGAAAGGAATLVALHDAAFLIGQGLVISVNTVILGSLLWTSRAVPRPLALLGLAGGSIVLGSNLAQLFGLVERGGTVAAVCAVPVFVFEIWFALRLIVRGLRTPRQAAEPSSVLASMTNR